MLCSVNGSHPVIAFTLAVVLWHPACWALPAGHQGDAQDPDITVLIDELSTAQRETAKARLLEIGVRAAPQLIARLRDLTEFVEQPIIVDPARLETFDPYTDPDVLRRQKAWDVMEDCVGLLGEMKSEEAVPAIIKSLETRMPSGREPKVVQETVALKEIGPPAVPALIDALARAPETARNRKSNVGPSERIIQARMALALAEIGDPRAIPALEDLIRIEPSFGRGFVADAIAKMLNQQPQ
ncbi:MAG TPA: hypothetical protein VJX67_19530 [Blastocatellia bacterium]|nr:hypothetical protein [Blastocatellia bacterium]